MEYINPHRSAVTTCILLSYRQSSLKNRGNWRRVLNLSCMHRPIQNSFSDDVLTRISKARCTEPKDELFNGLGLWHVHYTIPVNQSTQTLGIERSNLNATFPHFATANLKANSVRWKESVGRAIGNYLVTRWKHLTQTNSSVSSNASD